MDKYFTKDFWSTLSETTVEWLITRLPAILILFVLLFITLKFIDYFKRRTENIILNRLKRKEEIEDVNETEKRVHTLMDILRGTLKIVVWSMFIMIFLKKVNIDIAPLLAGAGIVGLAVGFGAQELVRDFITGFFILLENQVRAGDVAIINGTGGLVEKIELRTITLRDFSGVVHIVQNGKINTLSNMTKEWSAMVFDIGVAYKENVDAVMKVIKEVGDELQNDAEFGKNIIEPIEIFGVDQFADSAVVIKARIKTKPIQQWTIGRQFRGRLKKAFDAKGIEIPFPHTTVYWGEKANALDIKLNAENNTKG